MDLTVSYAKERLQTFIDELRHVAESEFPYTDSKDALTLLQQHFEDRLTRLRAFDTRSNPGVVRNECALALQALFVYLPLLGFILRSTNVRNAFEVFGPLLRLSRQFLDTPVGGGKPTQLLLSSEWDYSPLSYPEIPALPGFVLIGLPASESSNPLLVPLAGHELGHAKWIKTALETKMTARAYYIASQVVARRWAEFVACVGVSSTAKPADLTTDLLLLGMWQSAVDWAVRQAEETFCDCVGVGIFGRSYLEAFAYLLSPGHQLGRSLLYPSMNARIANALEAARAYGVDPPADYATLFDDEQKLSLSTADQFRLEVADETLRLLVPEIIREGGDQLKQATITLPATEDVTRIVDRYRMVVPADAATSLSAIVNAAWCVTNDDDFWRDIPQISDKRSILKELVLKNIEILEIEHITRS